MVNKIKYFKIVKTESELESLILESILIKKYLPKYNVLLKDDKNYLYVKITDEEYPRVLAIRKKIKTLNINIFLGPFHHQSKLEQF